jgi:hypothetical protein
VQAVYTIPAGTAPERAAIRIRLEGSKDKSPKELLTEAKKAIPGAYTVYPLKSRDVDIIVPDQATKDRIFNQPLIEGCRILQQDYLIEVPWVSLSLQVSSRPSTDNSITIQEICKGTKRTIPGIAINCIK